MNTTDRIRIAMLSVHSCPVGHLGTRDTGGMSVYIRELAQELGKKGHLVDVYTRVHDPRDNQMYELGNNARLVHLTAGEDEQINKLAVYSHIPDFACNLENFRKQNNLQYDLIYSNYWLSGLAGKYPQIWWDVPHVITFHTLGAIKNAIGIGEDEPVLRIEMEKDIVQSCHRVIATTDKEKAALALHYEAIPEKIGIVPCGVNLEHFKPLDKNELRKQLGIKGEKIILFVGRIEPLKGAEQLLIAVSDMKNIPRLELLIIGGDESNQDEIGHLKKMSTELDIQDKVKFPGVIKHDKLQHYYNAADVCVVPSYYESFGLVALESLACGTPVISTDVGDIKNIINREEAGYVLPDNNPRSMAEKIEIILSRPVNDKETTSLIRATVEKYSWSNIAEEIAGELRLVLDSYPVSVS